MNVKVSTLYMTANNQQLELHQSIMVPSNT